MDDDDNETMHPRVVLELDDVPDPPGYLGTRYAWRTWVEDLVLPYVANYVPRAIDADYFLVQFLDAEPDEDGQVAGSEWELWCEEYDDA